MAAGRAREKAAGAAALSVSVAMDPRGVWHQAGNARDEAAMRALAEMPDELVQEAARDAAAQDPRATAWVGATLAKAKRLAAEARARQQRAEQIKQQASLLSREQIAQQAGAALARVKARMQAKQAKAA